MNILHMKYAVEIARAGSINKASDILLIAQPNLSRSVKELEADLGITIFDRSAKGMFLTPEGEEFINYATSILNAIEEVEDIYKGGHHIRQRFSISVPRATYIANAFSKFTQNLSGDPAEIFYNETNSMHAIDNILSSGYKLGIIRYAENHDKYFKDMLNEKGLNYELLAEFRYSLVVSIDSPLAKLDEIHLNDLTPYIEVAHADPFVPSLSASEVRKEELPANVSRRIFVFERGGQFNILSENSDSFIWSAPLPKKHLERFGLVQRECSDNKKIYKDVLIYKKDYKLTKLDNMFITELCREKRLCFPEQ
ncbi:MAG: LysR family transcriptional regulator [Ruminococcaceae bacterium]|nr:LysR family transcriptional regulator [Oscillospiraceae bacterium]